VLSGYLKSIGPGKNSWVGIAEGAQGLVQVLTALPSGYFGDKFGRQAILKFSSAVGFLAVVVFFVSLHVGAWYDGKEGKSDGVVEFLLMCVALSLFGCFDGASSGSMEAIFHDSLETSERPPMTTVKFITAVFFRATGPVLSALLFLMIGDTWTRPQLRTVFFTGLGLTLIPFGVLLLFRDSDSLGMESEAAPHSPLLPMGQVLDESLEDGVPSIGVVGSAENELSTPLLSDEGEPPKLRGAKYYIPRMVLASDIMFGLASGMTIKFFPLFFKEETGLSPAEVNLIYVVAPLLVVCLSILATQMTKVIGRVRVPILSSTLGVLLLFIMWQMGLQEGQPMWKNTKIIVPVYLLRTALMNCSPPIRKSILIDFVDKASRAWWNSMDSISKVSWSGSAVIGGVIADKYGYGASFLATALVQSIATLLMSALLLYEARIEQAGRKRTILSEDADSEE